MPIRGIKITEIKNTKVCLGFYGETEIFIPLNIPIMKHIKAKQHHIY